MRTASCFSHSSLRPPAWPLVSPFFHRDAPPALPTQLWRLPRPRD